MTEFVDIFDEMADDETGKMLNRMATDSYNPVDHILENGHSIVYAKDDTPEGCILREYPNGKIELLRVDLLGGRHKILNTFYDR